MIKIYEKDNNGEETYICNAHDINVAKAIVFERFKKLVAEEIYSDFCNIFDNINKNISTLKEIDLHIQAYTFDNTLKILIFNKGMKALEYIFEKE